MKIEKECSLHMQCWYLDDGTLVGDTVELSKAFKIIQEEGPKIGLVMNVTKTELFWPSKDDRIESLGLFPAEISRPVKGVKLLGGGVSTDREFLNSLTVKRAMKAQELMELIKGLENPQMELILLRACLGVSKLYFTLRTCSGEGLIEMEDIADNALRETLEHIMSGGRGGFGDTQARITTLPIRLGELGVITVEDSKKYAYIASYLQTERLQNTMFRRDIGNRGKCFQSALDVLQEAIPTSEVLKMSLELDSVPRKLMKLLAEEYFKEISKDMVKEYSLSSRQVAVWRSLQVPHAQDFLHTLPIEGLGQTMTSAEYRAVLGYRLMVPMFIEGLLCSGCNKVSMDQFGDHAIHCKFDPGIKLRHDTVRDGLVDIMRRAGIGVRKEALISLVKEGGKEQLRPADILVYNWIHGKHTCVDLSGCSPMVGIDRGTFDPFKALMNLVKYKYDKHEGACQDAGMEFVPFGFTSFGGLGTEAIELMGRIEKIVKQHFFCYKSSNFIYHRLGFFIQKGVAAQLVGRLPINFVSD